MLSLILSAIFLGICILLMIVILLQKGRGGGLSGAFGGAGGHSAFGTKTGDVMTWTTVVLACLFLLSAVTLNLLYTPGDTGGLGATIQPPAVPPAGAGLAPAAPAPDAADRPAPADAEPARDEPAQPKKYEAEGDAAPADE